MGNDRLAAHALRSGADGVVSGCAAAIPEILTGLERAIAASDDIRAQEIDARLHEFLEWIERFPAPMGIRRAVEVRGKSSGPAMNPLSPSRAAEMEEFANWLKNWLPVAKKAVAHA
jgi:dihydrodipicolinate synthase/N-acetylneuraminate lyase